MKFLKENNLIQVLSANSLSVITSFILGFISNKMVAVYLGPSGMALMGNFRNLGAMLKSVSTLGISTSLVKLVAENKNNKAALEEIYATFFTVFFLLSSLIGIGVYFFSGTIAQILFESDQWVFPIRCFGLSLPLVFINVFWLAIYNGLEQYKTQVFVQLLASIFVFMVSVCLIYYHAIEGAILGIALSEILMVFTTLVFVVRDKAMFCFHYRLIIRKDYLKAIQRFSSMALLTSILAPITLLIIRNSITLNYSITEAGLWDATTKLSSFYMLFFTSGLSLYYVPKFATMHTDMAFKKEIKNYYLTIVPIFSVILIVLYFLRELVLRWVFTSVFLKMETVLIWQFIGDFFKILTLIFGYQVLVKAKLKIYFFLELAFHLSYMFMSFYFIKNNGYQGAIQAYCYASIIGFILVLVIFRKLFKV